MFLSSSNCNYVTSLSHQNTLLPQHHLPLFSTSTRMGTHLLPFTIYLQEKALFYCLLRLGHCKDIRGARLYVHRATEWGQGAITLT